MTEKEVLEKLKIFKDALIKKNEKISELEKTIKEDNDLIEGLTNSNSDYQEKLKNNDSAIVQQLSKLTEHNEQLTAALSEKTADNKKLNEQLNTLNFQLSEEVAKNANLTLDLKDAKEATKENDEWKDKYDNLKSQTYKTIKHLVEDVIEEQEKQIEKLKEDVEMWESKAHQFSDDFTDADMENDKLKKEIEELKNKSVQHNKSLDVDGMMERIHTLDVDTSAVDETMKSIKRGERLFKQYSFGVANESTLNTFIAFINNIYENTVKKDRFYILNRPEVCKTSNMNDNTYNTFVKYLYDNKLIEKRGTSDSALEYVSVYSLKEVVDKVSKEC